MYIVEVIDAKTGKELAKWHFPPMEKKEALEQFKKCKMDPDYEFADIYVYQRIALRMADI